MGLGSVIGSAVTAFVGTNLDDLVVLVTFFADARNGKLKISQIWLGQALGFSFLVAVSMTGYLMASFTKPAYIGFLGILPVLIGLHRYWQLARECCNARSRVALEPTGIGHSDVDVEAREGLLAAALPASGSLKAGNGGSVKADGALRLTHSEPESVQSRGRSRSADATDSSNAATEDVEAKYLSATDVQAAAPVAETATPSKYFCCTTLLTGGVWQVALMTVANGGDNISIYIPLFASASGADILATLVIFYSLMALWLVMSMLFVKIKFVAEGIAEYGEYATPGLLIALGLFILWDQGSLALLHNAVSGSDDSSAYYPAWLFILSTSHHHLQLGVDASGLGRGQESDEAPPVVGLSEASRYGALDAALREA